MLYYNSFWTRSKYESFCDYSRVYLNSKTRMDPISIQNGSWNLGIFQHWTSPVEYIYSMKEKISFNSIDSKMNGVNQRIIVSRCKTSYNTRLFFSPRCFLNEKLANNLQRVEKSSRVIRWLTPILTKSLSRYYSLCV